MQWIRNISLVRRVVIGLGGVGLLMAAVGGLAVLRLSSQAALLEGWARAGGHPAAAELAAAQSGAAASASLIGGLSLLCGVLALLAAWLIRASIKESVESTVQCVVRIASGDLETRIESPGKDEISWLRAELNGMRKKLRKAVLEVRQTADGVNDATAEIASGNLDLSTRTESQAASLEQTSASIQQLAETVRSNAQSTQEARSVVAQSSAVALRGAEMMQDVVSRMAAINNSATRIADIIGTIDGIAFQTNILALNAAVEAARAGEQGRGFAVVASEVRSLAQRSSAAAREIKDLIVESSERVQAGSQLVDQAGHTMQEIVGSVNRASEIIARIAAAGESQSNDIGQVSSAVGQIDGMTQQNAALVEQLAASAQSLKGQSDRLTAAMGSFQVVA